MKDIKTHEYSQYTGQANEYRNNYCHNTNYSPNTHLKLMPCTLFELLPTDTTHLIFRITPPNMSFLSYYYFFFTSRTIFHHFPHN